MASRIPRTIYLGTFISAPHAGRDAKLEVREGAVLVSSEGVIERCDWSLKSVEEARRVFGLEEETWVRTFARGDGNGFWFPGFVGEFVLFL